MNIIQYLNEEYNDFDFDIMEYDFKENFKITIDREKDLYLFKYYVLSEFDNDIVRNCRGVILRHEDNIWRYVSRPFDKFFNIFEKYCCIEDEKYFNSSIDNFIFTEKADGTMIQSWYDDTLGVRRLSTTGKINPVSVETYSETFTELFNAVIGKNLNSSKNLQRGVTYLFELCTEKNRIVTKYNKSRVYLIGARSLLGNYLPYSELKILCKDLQFEGYNVIMPNLYNMKELGIKDLKGVKDFLSNLCVEGVSYPEGFVIWDFNGKPIAKIKSKKYLDISGLIGAGDFKHTKNIIIDRFFNNTLDDVYPYLTIKQKEFVSYVKDRYSKDVERVLLYYSNLVNKNIASYADLAKEVEKSIPRCYRGFYMSIKDSVVNNSLLDVKLEYRKYMEYNYKRRDKYWKGLEDI